MKAAKLLLVQFLVLALFVPYADAASSKKSSKKKAAAAETWRPVDLSLAAKGLTSDCNYRLIVYQPWTGTTILHILPDSLVRTYSDVDKIVAVEFQLVPGSLKSQTSFIRPTIANPNQGIGGRTSSYYTFAELFSNSGTNFPYEAKLTVTPFDGKIKLYVSRISVGDVQSNTKAGDVEWAGFDITNTSYMLQQLCPTGLR